jgi:hypothetical protein
MRPTKLSIALHSFSLSTSVRDVGRANLRRPAARRGHAERRRAERLEARGIGARPLLPSVPKCGCPNAHGQLAAARDSIVTAADDLILIASSRNLPEQSRMPGGARIELLLKTGP